MGEAAPSNPSPKSYYSMDCECRAHAAIFLARQEAACDPFSALNLSVDTSFIFGSTSNIRFRHFSQNLAPLGSPKGPGFFRKKKRRPA